METKNIEVRELRNFYALKEIRGGDKGFRVVIWVYGEEVKE